MEVVPYAFNYATLTLQEVTGNLDGDVEDLYTTILIPIDDTTTSLLLTDKITVVWPAKMDPIAL
jgi:hypothetical protein